MTRSRIALALVAVLAVPACQDMQDNPKQTMGTIVGAGLGALAGSQVGSGTGQMAAIAVGTLAGAWMGSEVGKSLDKADRQYASQATQNALEYTPSGKTTTWNNPDSGNYGSVTPVETYQTASGQDCREFETTITVDGKTEVAKGTACREPDGTWRIVP